MDSSEVVFYSVETQFDEHLYYFFNTRSDLDVTFYRLIGKDLKSSGSESYLAVL